MKNTTKFLALLLCLLMLVGTVASCARDEEENPNETEDTTEETEELGTEGLEYFPLDGDTYGVKGGTAKYLAEIVIPATHEGKAVTKILDEAFSESKELKTITIPNSITSIGASAFEGCSGLTSFTIPESVTSIGFSAFSRCSKMTSITIPFIGETKAGTENTHFGYIFGANKPFDNNDVIPSTLKNVIITGSSSIERYAFSYCDITTLSIPKSITSIDVGAFYTCSDLTKITVEEGNPKYHSTGNCLIETKSKTLILGCNTSVIPNDGSVTKIGDSAFESYHNITNIIIPDGVASIGNRAFLDCRFTSVTIPDSVTSIGNEAFFSCNNLTDIYFTGTVEEWNAIEKSNADIPTSATIHYNYIPNN